MNREKAETIADRIMTRIEQDGAIHKGALADEIQAGALLPEVVDIITKVNRADGTPFDWDADTKPEYQEHVARKAKPDLVCLDGVHPETMRLLARYGLGDVTRVDAPMYGFPLGTVALDIDDRDTE